MEDVSLTKILDFGYFVLISWLNKKNNNPEAEFKLKNMFIFEQNCFLLLLLLSDLIIFLMDSGALVIHIIVHNSLTQNRKRLKFRI